MSIDVEKLKQLFDLQLFFSGGAQSVWHPVHRIDVIYMRVRKFFYGYSTPLSYSAVVPRVVSLTIIPTMYCTVGRLSKAHCNVVEMTGAVATKQKTYQFHHNGNGKMLTGVKFGLHHAVNPGRGLYSRGILLLLVLPGGRCTSLGVVYSEIVYRNTSHQNRCAVVLDYQLQNNEQDPSWQWKFLFFSTCG